MSIFTSVLEQMPFMTALWLFTSLVVLHELEEWNIDRFERSHFKGVPAAATDQSARMVIAFVSAVGLVWCSIAALPGSPALAAWIFFPAVAFMLLNALQHIFWSFFFKKVAPGVLSAALLIIPCGSYLVSKGIGQGYVPGWYVGILGAAVVVGFTQTALSGSRMTAMIRFGNQVGIWLWDRIERRMKAA